MIKRANNRPKNNDGSEIDSSGRKIREVHPTDKAPKRTQTRGRVASSGEKRPKGQQETRDSTREPARGRAEFTGQLNKRMTNKGRQVRTSRTASKGK